MRLTGLWWWIDRWRKSTAYTDMTLEEQGAYRNLLDEAQLRGGPLPNDERILAKACGDALAWSRVRPAVMARFVLAADGWRNETLDRVIKESARRADKQRRFRDRGNAGGNANGNGHGNAHGSPDPDPDLTPAPDHEDQDQNKPTPKARRDFYAVEKSDAQRAPTDSVPPTVRDREDGASIRAVDRRQRMGIEDEGRALEAGVGLSGPGDDDAGIDAGRACDSQDDGFAASSTAGPPGAAGTATAGRSGVAEGVQAGWMDSRGSPHAKPLHRLKEIIAAGASRRA